MFTLKDAREDITIAEVERRVEDLERNLREHEGQIILVSREIESQRKLGDHRPTVPPPAMHEFERFTGLVKKPYLIKNDHYPFLDDYPAEIAVAGSIPVPRWISAELTTGQLVKFFSGYAAGRKDTHQNPNILTYSFDLAPPTVIHRPGPGQFHGKNDHHEELISFEIAFGDSQVRDFLKRNYKTHETVYAAIQETLKKG